MLTIRNAQLIMVDRAHRAQYIARMAEHLRAHFARELADIEEPALHEHVATELDRAARYGLTSEQDGCRFLGVSAACGWGFEERPENAWMKECLTDSRVSSPSMRLRMLVDEVLYRSAVTEENRRIAVAFGLPADESP